MKHIIFFSLIFSFIFLSSLSAQEEAPITGAWDADIGRSVGLPDNSEKTADEAELADEKKAKKKKESLSPDLWRGQRQQRYFEIGLVGARAGIDNSIFTLGDVFGAFKGEVFFDAKSIADSGFTFNLDLFAKPFHIKLVFPRFLDIEFFTKADIRMYGDIDEGTLKSISSLQDFASSFNSTGNSATDIDNVKNKLQGMEGSLSAAASGFAEIGFSFSKTIFDKRLWLKVSPSVFFTMFYMPSSSIRLTNFGVDNSGAAEEFMGLRGNGIISVYSSYDIKSSDYAHVLASPGFDISLEGRFAAFSFLDFGLRVDSIPIMPSTTNYKTGVDLNLELNVVNPSYDWSNNPEKLEEYLAKGIGFDAPDMDNMFTSSQEENFAVSRPTRINFEILFKPFNSNLFVVKPNFGLSINSVLAPLLMNYGAELQLNLPAVFSAALNIGVDEMIWRNMLTTEIDFRVFELDIGVALQGPKFVDSWRGKGLAAIIGFKVGY
ncbi:MAG: hypothetical protein Ta2G_00360 [Termitinemataceae bacterium]|nr:MAG: hypothetical protein Ta2G_00360 [Termitinemataceae bacterium]